MRRLLPLLFLTACTPAQSSLEILAGLPENLRENSTVEVIGDELWTVQDHGNTPQLFALDKAGKPLRTITVRNVENHDWEELTSDASGNLYVGDFGNNDNDRKDLAIYRIAASELRKTDADVATTTRFHYPEQNDFPARPKDRHYDCEAFFEYRGNFYLFTKNRSSKFDGTTYLYQVPNKPGSFAARRIGSYKTCDHFRKCAVTAADISDDGKTVALLTGDSVFLFTDFQADDFLSGSVRQIPLGAVSQKEGLGFDADGKLFITDEAEKKRPARLYRLDPSKAETDAHE